MLRVGQHLFLMAIERSSQKFRVGRVGGNTAIFYLRLIFRLNVGVAGSKPTLS